MALTRPDLASAYSTFQMTWKRFAPIDSAASITPRLTSSNVDSTNLAKYGIQLIVIGTMAAFVPIEVPTINLVKGIIAIVRIKNGKERTKLTTAFKMVLNNGAFTKEPSRVK